MIILDQFSVAAQARRANSREAKLEKVQIEAQLVSQSRLSQVSESQAAEAHERYLAGCVMPFAKVEGDEYAFQVVTVAEGEQVLNPDTGRPLSNGQLVCDDRGLTFEIVGGVAQRPLRATDMALVNQRFEDSAGWNPAARRSDVFAD